MINLTFYPTGNSDSCSLKVKCMEYIKEKKEFKVEFNDGCFYVNPLDILFIQ